MAGNNFDTSITIRAGVEGISDLNQLIHAIEQAGGDVSQLRQQATQLQNTWNTLTTEEQTQQLNALAQSANGVARTTNTATAQMERFLGVRSNNTINQEITQVNHALTTLQQRLNAGTISQQEFNRLSQAGQTRLNALQAELNQTAGSLNRMETAGHTAGGGIDKLTKNLMGMAGAYVGIQSVTEGIKQLIDTSKQMDSLNAKLEYATGSAKEAGETFEYLKGISNELGLEQMGLAEGYAQLASATKGLNMSQADTRTAFEGVAKATAAMSLSADEANGVFLALSQIASKGKVSMEELRGQLGERLTPAFGIAADAMGVTTQELEKMVENGINAKEFLPKFGAAMSEAFGNQASKNLETTSGQINQITNKLTELKTNVLDKFADEAISGSLSFISSGIDSIGNAIDNIDPATINATKEVFAQLFGLIGTLAERLKQGYDNLNSFFDGFSGVDSASERVGFLTRTIQGLSIVIGAVDDIFKGLGATADFAIGGITAAFAKLYAGMAKMDILPDSMQQKYQQISDGLQKMSDDSFAHFDKSVNGFESSAKKALDATMVSADQMAEQAEIAAKRAIASFEKLAKDGTASGENLKNSFTEAVSKATDPEQVEGLITKLTELKDKGVITGEELAQGLQIAKPKAEELEKQFGKSTDSLEKLGLAGEKSAEDIKTKMADTATTLGLDFEKASNKTTQGFEKVAQATLNLGQNFSELKKEGYDATNLIEQGITKMISSAKNKADFDLLNATIKKMGDEGKLSGDQVTKALDNSKKKATELQIGLSETEKAYKAMGLASQQDLTKKAAEYKQYYDQIAKDATASSTIKQQAYQKWAQAAVDANNGVITSEVKTQAVARGYADVSVENGKVATKTAEDIEKANQKAEESHNSVTKSVKEQGDATKEAADKDTQATQQQISNGQGVLGMMQNITSSIKQKMTAIEGLSVSAAQADDAFKNLLDGMGYFEGYQWGSFTSFVESMNQVNAVVEMQIDGFQKVRNAAIKHTQALGDANVSVNDLADAEGALRIAQDANIAGIVKMDNATLDNLRRQIDSTRQKLDDLADSAKATADNLEADLARIKGDDATAQKLEQTRKLTELQEKLNEAQQRGNSEEISQLQRAVELQKQINVEQSKQAETKKQQEQQAKAQKQQEQTQKQQAQSKPTPTPTPAPVSSPIPISTSGTGDNPNIAYYAKLTAEQIAKIEDKAIEKFMKILQDEIKRQAR